MLHHHTLAGSRGNVEGGGRKTKKGDGQRAVGIDEPGRWYLYTARGLLFPHDWSVFHGLEDQEKVVQRRGAEQ